MEQSDADAYKNRLAGNSVEVEVIELPERITKLELIHQLNIHGAHADNG